MKRNAYLLVLVSICLSKPAVSTSQSMDASVNLSNRHDLGSSQRLVQFAAIEDGDVTGPAAIQPQRGAIESSFFQTPRSLVPLEDATARVVDLARAGEGASELIVTRFPRLIDAGNSITDAQGNVVRIVHQPTWLFLVDDDPSMAWPHAARIVLVGAHSGALESVPVSSSPLVNGYQPMVWEDAFYDPRNIVYTRDPNDDGPPHDVSFDDGDEQLKAPPVDDVSYYYYWLPTEVGGVDIDVNVNRNDTVEDDDDDKGEDENVDYLGDRGALVLVNCDKDGKVRDMDDDRIAAGGDDLLDLSPISIELERTIDAKRERVWLSIRNDGTKKEAAVNVAWMNLMDKNLAGSQIVIGGNKLELDVTDAYFADGKPKRYDNRFFLEGLRFGEQVRIRIEIRDEERVIAEDEVRVLNTPWLANNNTSPMAETKRWKIPGNLVNSKGFPFAGVKGATTVLAGTAQEFVQDEAEWGFQLRRHKEPKKGRAMITALTLIASEPTQHPQKQFLTSKVAVYGYKKSDERYADSEHKNGDAGGNLDALPPTKKFPFGRLLIGNTISSKLKSFLARQKVQWPAVELDVTSIGLFHVDEVAMVVPDKSAKALVIMPDWTKGMALMRKHLDANPNMNNVGVPYRDVVAALDNNQNPDAQKYENHLAALQKKMKGEGVEVVGMPQLFFMPGSSRQKSFPRSIANSQPTSRGTLIVSRPPLETSPSGKQQKSSFFLAWQRILDSRVELIGQDLTNAWNRGGEAHCASNAIRKPIIK